MVIHMKAGAHIYKIAKEQEYAFSAWLWHESIKKKKQFGLALHNTSLYNEESVFVFLNLKSTSMKKAYLQTKNIMDH